MASGDTLLAFSPLADEPPATGYATFDTRNGHPVLDFDAASRESAVFSGVLPHHYSGGGLTVVLVWAATSATQELTYVKWSVALERLNAPGNGLDVDSFAAAVDLCAAPTVDCGKLRYTQLYLAGAALDGLEPGEALRLKITREADDAQDTMSGDAELRFAIVKET